MMRQRNTWRFAAVAGAVALGVGACTGIPFPPIPFPLVLGEVTFDPGNLAGREGTREIVAELDDLPTVTDIEARALEGVQAAGASFIIGISLSTAQLTTLTLTAINGDLGGLTDIKITFIGKNGVEKDLADQSAENEPGGTFASPIVLDGKDIDFLQLMRENEEATSGVAKLRFTGTGMLPSSAVTVKIEAEVLVSGAFQ